MLLDFCAHDQNIWANHIRMARLQLIKRLQLIVFIKDLITRALERHTSHDLILLKINWFVIVHL
jgi:hypothetical protein